MMKLDGINYTFDIVYIDDTCCSIVIINIHINCKIPSGYFFGIGIYGLERYSNVNREFEFDRDVTNRNTVKITGMDEVE